LYEDLQQDLFRLRQKMFSRFSGISIKYSQTIEFFEIINKINYVHVLQDQRKLEKATEILDKALAQLMKYCASYFQEKSGEAQMIKAQILNNQATLFLENNKFDQALERALRASEINSLIQETNFSSEIATNLVNISSIYQAL
jgi:uncharacterized protein (DUF3084 family)